MKPPHASKSSGATWSELFRGPRAVYTLLLNLGISLHAIDIFIISTVMPTVVEEIGGVAYYAWAVTLYVVGSIVGSASFAPLRVTLGARAAYALGGIAFLAGTATCALAPEMSVLLAGRSVQGWGAGVAMGGSYALIGTLFEARLRPYVLTTNNVTWTIATLLGPTLGGVFAEIGWWRGAFWVVVPLVVLFIGFAWWKVPDTRGTGREARPRFPFFRLVLLAGGVFCVAESGQIPNVAARVALLALAVAAMWYAFRRDATAENRLFPTSPLSPNHPVGVSYWAQFLMHGAQTTLYIYLPLILQLVQGLPPLYVGAANGCLSLGWSLGAAVVVGWSGARERAALVMGPALFGIAIAWLAVDVADASLAMILAVVAVVGIGMGMYNVLVVAKTMSVARPGEESITSSSLATVRSLGVAFGSAAAGLVANTAGLTTTAGAEPVARAVTWVFFWDLLPVAAAVLLILRLLQLLSRRLQPAE